MYDNQEDKGIYATYKYIGQAVEKFPKKLRETLRAKRLQSDYPYMRFLNKEPRCDDLTTKRFVVGLGELNEKRELTGVKWAKVGCGYEYLCMNCGDRIATRRAKATISLANCLYQRFSRLETVRIVFTCPDDHRISYADNRRAYNDFYGIVRDTLKEYYGADIGAVLTLHNWSSERPEEKNIHIHSYILGVDADGILHSGFVEVERLREIFRRNLNYHKGDVDIWVEYYKSDAIKFLYQKFKYDFRSPINDFADFMVENRPDEPLRLSKKYLERVGKLKGMHHTRYFGWLSNSTKKKALEKLGIAERIFDKADKFEFLGFFEIVQVVQIDDETYFRLDNKEYVRTDDVLPADFLTSYKLYSNK